MGSWVGTAAGVLVGSLLVLGVGSAGGGWFSSRGASAPPSAYWGWSPALPVDLLVPSTSGLSWLSSVSSPVASATAAQLPSRHRQI